MSYPEGTGEDPVRTRVHRRRVIWPMHDEERSVDGLPRQILRARTDQALRVRQRREARDRTFRRPGRPEPAPDRGGAVRVPQPLSKGAILADEVGLGKTIEAGILLAQKWAERKRRLLVICPANLRKQWSQELADKFFLPSAILETRTFNEAIKRREPQSLSDRRRCHLLVPVRPLQGALRSPDPWDLVVIDEAHRLRNVYKTNQQNQPCIKQAVAPFPKVLLTATPLQNSLLELYGLVSIIDDFTFGDLKSFRAHSRGSPATRTSPSSRSGSSPSANAPCAGRCLNTSSTQTAMPWCRSSCPRGRTAALRSRLRLPATTTLYALPASQRQLDDAHPAQAAGSSTYAISDTLEGLGRPTSSCVADAAEACRRRRRSSPRTWRS